MITLYDLMNEKLCELDCNNDFPSLDKFMTSDSSSVCFIKSLTSGFDDSESQLIDETVTQARARHSALTFLMGMVLLPFAGVFSSMSNTLNLDESNNFQIWTIVSLNHDRGYYSAYLKKEDTELNKIVKYYLFNDYESLEWLKCNNEFSTLFPSVLAYSYDEILSYDRYARKYHKERNDKNERIDHGILGGVLTYNRLVNTLKRIVLNKESLNIIKAASLTIAQHNIYKSSCVESDKNYPSNLLYKLGSSSNFKITTSLPILYLLSFVDSIECVKVLSKSDNNGKYLETLTVLKNIEVDISERRLVLDFTSLTSNVKAKNFKDLESKYSKHLDSFMSMNKWLDVSVTRDGDCFVFTKD